MDFITMNSLTEKSNKKCIKCKFKCNTILFQKNFKNWTSANKYIDKFIQDTQLLAHDDIGEVLEWIPYDRFDNIEYIEKIGICRAHWIDGCIDKWDDENQSWKRYNRNILVTLKGLLHDPKDITLEFMNEIKIDYEFYGITQDPQTKSYMMVLNDKCKECNYLCNAIHFQRNFENWTSGDDNIDKLIQNTQLSTHDNAKEALEWIPYYRFNNIKYVEKIDVYRANWIDGCIVKWDNENQNWKRYNKNVVVILKNINSSNYSSFAFISEITSSKKLRNNSRSTNKKLYDGFVGNKYIDKFIQDTQLLAHHNTNKALEWIPYDRFNNIKYIKKIGVYIVNWIDGYIFKWDDKNQNWKRSNQNIFVTLKEFNVPKDITLELMNEIKKDYKFYGITQDPQTKNYMMVLDVKCKKCNYKCSTIRFQQNFGSWTSGNDEIDGFIQDTQLSAHYSTKSALEWIPYDRFCNIKYIVKRKLYEANWIDGYIIYWDNKDQNCVRKKNMLVVLKNLNNPKNVTLELMNMPNYATYGITQDPQTKNYMMVLELNNECKKCNFKCSVMHFYQNFENWTSGNDDIDKFIQDTQLSAHHSAKAALEWIPYDRFCDIKYTVERKLYNANWIDGYIIYWDYKNHNWARKGQNILVSLKSLNNPKNITFEFMNEIKIDLKRLDLPKYVTIKFRDKIEMDYEFYGITQDPQTKNYMIVLNNKCKKCNQVCDAIHFQQNFESWTSGNDNIDKFIQNTQLSTHCNVSRALEWIPHGKFNNIEYIAKGGFGKVYKANWIDGHIDKWNNINQNWKRRDENMFVALKSLDHSKNITLKFMNEMIFHHNIDSSDNIVKFYGITQDPQTYNYIMVMEYANDGSLREYLKTNFNKLNWESKITYLYDIITGLKFIHDNYLIHRDLHIGNILKLKYKVAITDMGLCKPTISNARKNNIYGVLPYIAPEILRGQTYTSAADIYSFGMIMYEIISGLPPFHDVGHDNYLAIKICRGLRPRFNIKVPQLIVSLIKRCLDASPSNRPKVKEISKILREWIYELNESYKFGQTELKRQIKEADIINNNSSNNRIPSTSLGLSYETHSEAVYTSRLLDFDDLPEPKNLDDYSEHNENIISVESSVSLSLQIDVNNNNNNLPEPKKVDNCYKQNDNLISVKSSASLSISQLNINNDTFSEPKNSDKQNNDVTGMEYSGIISTFVEWWKLDRVLWRMNIPTDDNRVYVASQQLTIRNGYLLIKSSGNIPPYYLQKYAYS
ncbi:hypothetical protein RclHR1_01510009 [Rhizophagus clarus]|uniref:Protein kinase domain-containing protein n=1 Tax=Rhizophagus clarus TaxID=94130 RepID=A0A2Z6R751_9GLOM|nr:hypothetical protein RclHR1_01510009 [Rhizophagus clarus]